MDWNRLADALIRNLEDGYSDKLKTDKGDRLIVSHFGLRAALMCSIEEQAILIKIHKPGEPIQYPDILTIAEGVSYQRVQ